MSEALREGEDLLRGKVAVVTGAARGIGRATAIALARAGADLAGIDICASVHPASGVEPASKADLDETGREVEKADRRWLGLVLDHRDLSALRTAAEHTEREFGGVDILFANAGIQTFKPLLEMDDAYWRIQIDNNLTGTPIEISVREPATTHTVCLSQIRRGCDGIAVSPDELQKQKRVKELIGT